MSEASVERLVLIRHAKPGLESWIDRLALQREYAKDALMRSAQRLLADETLESFNPESKLPAGERSFGTYRS